jgi:pimeloyl-ACP methyl ester carboxylesterase
MAPVAKCLSDRFRVLEPLQRGSGNGSLSVAVHVADLREALRDSLREGPIHLVGFSWGAMLALTYAARYPDDVDRVIAVGCGTFDSRARRAYQAEMSQRMGPDVRARVDELQARLVAEPNQSMRDTLFAELGNIYTRLGAFDPLEIEGTEAVHADERAFRETWSDAVSLQTQGVQPAEFARITAVVTMIHGSDDPHPRWLIHESLSPFIRTLTYRELPRCGHKPWTERRAQNAFYAALIECLP